MKTAYFNRFEFDLPDECIEDCASQGDVTKSVKYWQSILNLHLNKDLMMYELKEYGAWSAIELIESSHANLECKLIWIAACNLKENN